ncbi:MAG TPA: hypothetical protein VFN42_00400, partial [Acetobacteraceae bacterium]|nr:hypothetical protein [Acetobacteraceae bacterium]
QDSLLVDSSAWTRLAPEGFAAVVANPPWEKIKLSRHEFIKRNGGTRQYGAAYAGHDLSGYETGRVAAAARSAALARLYPVLASGEPDLYVAFTALLLRLTRPGGAGAVFVPGGMIRSQNTAGLRRLLLQCSRTLSFTVLENRAKFFAIDTRFKFVLCRFDAAEPKGRKAGTIQLAHAYGTEAGVRLAAPVRMARKTLADLSPDLTIPEVRDRREWQLFQKMQRAGLRWSDRASPWYPAFCREVDMTRETQHFRRSPGPDLLPVIEGRMVQPHRFGAKAYQSGQGRSALWVAVPLGAARVVPQFWIAPAALPKSVAVRANMLRVGFCDITGQTNERSMMAALIPAGVVCGNKVPTILFPNDPSDDRLFLWAAIVNSLPFDWALRRVMTTTVNYFLLLGLTLPRIEPDSLPGRRLVDIARRLALLDRAGPTGTEIGWRAADLRAEADAIVAMSYGLSQDDLLLMFRDFPLLDRGQPALLDEPKSTVTRDCVLARFAALRRGASLNGPTG